MRGDPGDVILVFVLFGLAALLVDHFGMVGFDEHPATLGRVAGMLLVALGVVFVAAVLTTRNRGQAEA